MRLFFCRVIDDLRVASRSAVKLPPWVGTHTPRERACGLAT